MRLEALWRTRTFWMASAMIRLSECALIVPKRHWRAFQKVSKPMFSTRKLPRTYFQQLS